MARRLLDEIKLRETGKFRAVGAQQTDGRIARE
jgi:hypothetical protein